MKKLFLSLLFTIFLCVGLSFSKLSAEIAPPIDGGGTVPGTIISDLEIKSNTPVPLPKSFNYYVHNVFGSISFDSEAFDYEKKLVYHSGWTGEKLYDDYRSIIYETYSFDKYIDLPTKTLHNRKIAAGESAAFTLQTTYSTSESSTTTSEKTTNFFCEFTLSAGYNVGVSFPIKLINLDIGANISGTIKVGASVSEKISSTKSTSTYYSTIYTETFLLDNTKSASDTYFEMNYRQKFKAYFTTKYKYNYNSNPIVWTSGLFGRDKHYDYSIDNYTPIGTYIYLLPVESTYFEVSKYYDNKYGVKEIIKINPNDNIIYL